MDDDEVVEVSVVVRYEILSLIPILLLFEVEELDYVAMIQH